LSRVTVPLSRAEEWGWSRVYYCKECSIEVAEPEPILVLCPRCLTIYRGNVALLTAIFETEWRKQNPPKPKEWKSEVQKAADARQKRKKEEQDT